MIDVVSKFDASGKERLQEKDFDERRGIVRVEPTSEHLRKVLKHGVTKVGFLAEGSAEWPNDVFTRRRIADGDVRLVVEKKDPEQPAPAVQQQRRASSEPSKT